jgi:hypothetical protein
MKEPDSSSAIALESKSLGITARAFNWTLSLLAPGFIPYFLHAYHMKQGTMQQNKTTRIIATISVAPALEVLEFEERDADMSYAILDVGAGVGSGVGGGGVGAEVGSGVGAAQLKSAGS